MMTDTGKCTDIMKEETFGTRNASKAKVESMFVIKGSAVYQFEALSTNDFS